MQLLNLRDELLNIKPHEVVKSSSERSLPSQECASIYTKHIWNVFFRYTAPEVPEHRSLSLSHEKSSSRNVDSALLERKKKGTASVDVEDGKYMAMLKILPSGNLIRSSLSKHDFLS